MAEKNIIKYLATVVHGHSRTVEGESYKSIFGGEIIIQGNRFPLMTTDRVQLFDIIEALNYKHMSVAIASLMECPFSVAVVECTKRHFTMQLYIMQNTLYAQINKYLTYTKDFAKDLARVAMCHRAIAFKLNLQPGPLKIIFGEVRMTMDDQKRLETQIKKKPRMFPELTFKAKSKSKSQLDARDIMLSGYYPL